MSEIKEITGDQAQVIFDSGTDGHRKPSGQFIVTQPDGTFTAIDNDHGCAWMEEFASREQAEFWLGNSNLEAQDVVEAMERAEAEGCPYCNPNNSVPKLWNYTKNITLYINTVNGARCLQVVATGFCPTAMIMCPLYEVPCRMVVPMKFCPECGRELEEAKPIEI